MTVSQGLLAWTISGGDSAINGLAFAGLAAGSDAATKPRFPMRLANAAQRVRTTLNSSVLTGFSPDSLTWRRAWR
jgi:hypothetical protein